MVQYLHGDHLGSTSLSTDSSGQEVSGSRTLYYPYGEERWSASGGTLTTDYGFTGQRRERGIGLYDYNARFYDPYLNRFISPDTIIPNSANPQSFNRYSYVLGNPLKYTDPSGHCSGDPNDPSNSDAGCWEMIRQIEGTYDNIYIFDTDVWQEQELLAVWNALLGHVFIEDILSAPFIKLFRKKFYKSEQDGVGGLTQRVGRGYNVTLYDDAKRLLPDGSRFGQESIRNFEGTVIHELAHIAIHENPFIRESHALRSNPIYYPSSLLPGTFGQAYNPDACRKQGTCDTEVIAMAASTWQLMPESFDGRFLVVSYTDWHSDWIELFYTPNPQAQMNYGPTFITAAP